MRRPTFRVNAQSATRCHFKSAKAEAMAQLPGETPSALCEGDAWPVKVATWNQAERLGAKWLGARGSFQLTDEHKHWVGLILQDYSNRLAVRWTAPAYAEVKARLVGIARASTKEKVLDAIRYAANPTPVVPPDGGVPVQRMDTRDAVFSRIECLRQEGDWHASLSTVLNNPTDDLLTAVKANAEDALHRLSTTIGNLRRPQTYPDLLGPCCWLAFVYHKSSQLPANKPIAGGISAQDEQQVHLASTHFAD